MVSSFGQSQLESNLSQYEEQKFNIQSMDATISNKQVLQGSRPSKVYIEVSFNKDNEAPLFQYFVFQNFYVYSVTVKQLKPVPQGTDIKEFKKNESNWTSILKNYRLMQNAHFETDA